MSRFIAWPIALALFWMGDAVSRLLHYDATAFMYPVYNRLMCASLDVQDWAGGDGRFWPWRAPEDAP